MGCDYFGGRQDVEWKLHTCKYLLFPFFWRLVFVPDDSGGYSVGRIVITGFEIRHLHVRFLG